MLLIGILYITMDDMKCSFIYYFIDLERQKRLYFVKIKVIELEMNLQNFENLRPKVDCPDSSSLQK